MTAPYAVFTLEGTSLRADFASALIGQGFAAGPLLRWRRGRDDVENPAVDALPEIDDAVELGGFVGYGLPGPLGSDGISVILEAAADVADGHGGIVVTPRLSYALPIGDDLRLNLGTAVTIGNGDYTDAYFAVTPAGAAASGLPVFAPGAGLSAVGLALGIDHSLTERWGLYGQIAWTRLVGDAADSPVVDAADGVVAGLAIRYRF